MSIIPKTSRLVTAFLLYCLLFWSATSNAAQANREDKATISALQEIDVFLRDEMKERRIPGMQYAIIKDGKIIALKSMGIANIQHRVPVTASTLFSINSATKSFTGVAVMQLVAEGKIALDQPIAKYLPELPPDWQPVTIQQLLSHTSGIPNIINQQTSRLDDPKGFAAAWKSIQLAPLDFPPGTRFSYNQTNYLLLGKLIEQQSKQTFTTFFQSKQFDVVHMPNTGFGDTQDVVLNKANSYRYSADGKTLKNVIEDFPLPLRTGAGINTNAKELATWLIALQDNKLLKKTELARLWQAGSFNNGSAAPWAMGWPAIRSGKYRAVAGIGGARSAFYVYPDAGLSVIMLTNLSGAEPEQLIDTVAGFLLPPLREINGDAYALYRLRQYVRDKGLDKLKEKFEDIRAKFKLTTPSDDALNTWAYRLLNRGEIKSAIAIFKFEIELYPNSFNAHDSLAEAYESDGDIASAIRHYHLSLQFNAKNEHAIERLKSLE